MNTETTLITGAASGIGLALAHELLDFHQQLQQFAPAFFDGDPDPLDVLLPTLIGLLQRVQLTKVAKFSGFFRKFPEGGKVFPCPFPIFCSHDTGW